MSYALGQGTGPLRGVRVVEIAGIGPGPHGATILADLGADVIRLERPGGTMVAGTGAVDLLTRGRPSVALDLKAPGATDVVLDLVGSAGRVEASTHFDDTSDPIRRIRRETFLPSSLQEADDRPTPLGL